MRAQEHTVTMRHRCVMNDGGAQRRRPKKDKKNRKANTVARASCKSYIAAWSVSVRRSVAKVKGLDGQCFEESS